MLLKSLELENIRSYTKARVEFPEGSVMLSGDVGSGKSTLLLAVQFALFGIQRGELSGTELLRHGANKGFVKLLFESGGRDITINRALVREKGAVKQDAGWLELESKKYQKTPQEMRAFVLELLGYPEEYLTKNPEVFYYTVYTRQEGMKQILLDKPEERLSILRRIFGVDKYGRIRDNAQIALQEMRAMKRELEAFARDETEKQAQLLKRGEEKANVEKQLGQFRKELAAVESELSLKQDAAEAASNKIRALSARAQLAASLEAQLKQKEMRNAKIGEEIKKLEVRTEELSKKLLKKPTSPSDMSEKEISKRRQEAEEKSRSLLAEKSVLDSELRKMLAVIDKGRCEFCGQAVADRQHFAGEAEKRSLRVKQIDIEMKQVLDDRKYFEGLESQMTAYRYEIREYEKLAGDRDETKERISEGQSERTDNNTFIAENAFRLSQLKSELAGLPALELEEREAKRNLFDTQQKKLDVSKRLSGSESTLEAIKNETKRLEQEIEQKKTAREKSQRIAGLHSWLDSTFIPLMERMEQAVLWKIQHVFNGHFEDWFGIIMGAENLSVEVSDDFSPIIEQGGYQTEYNNLSGGEKTAVALSYRLALNKVINTLIENIRTKDLIILDEPTDGFSGEQVDRIRDVLSALNLRQMLIVSHEPKIDTFVNSVIRCYKEGHVSKVVGG